MKTQFYVLIFLLLFTTLYSIDPHLKVYTVEDGMPTHIIYDAAQDKDGFMWFATDKGLMKYDGAEWEIDFETRDDNQFKFIKTDANGNLWAIPHKVGQIYRYTEPGIWNPFISLDLRDSLFITDTEIYFTNNDTIITASTSTSVILLYNSKLESKFIRTTIDDLEVRKIIFNNGKYFLATMRGIYSSTNNFKKLNIVATIKDVHDICYSENKKRLYFITDQSLGYVKESDEIVVIKTDLKLVPPGITQTDSFLKHYNQNTIVFGSKYNAYQYNERSNQLLNITYENGFATNGATSAFMDYERNIWITSFRGLTKMTLSPFENYTTFNGLLSDEVSSINQLSSMIVLGHNNGITTLQDENITPFPFDKEDEYSGYKRVLRMSIRESDQNLIFISQHKGLGLFDKDKNIKWLLEPGDAIFSFTDLFIDENKIYLCMQNSLYYYTDNKIEKLAEFDKIIPRQTKRYDDSTLIIASKYGLVTFDEIDNKLTQITADEKHFSNAYALLKMNSFWLVGTKGGLCVFDGESIKKYDRLSIDNPIYFIKREKKYIWFGLMGGAIRWNPKTNEYYHFTSKDGMIGEETNRDAFLYKDGLVYIGTDKGLSVFDPELHNTIDYGVKPKLKIVSLQDSENNDYDFNVPQQISYSKNTLTLQYRGLSFRNENSLQYKILIQSLDDDTTETFKTTGTEYFIRNLNPGNYKIGVQVINNRGVESEINYTSEIKILAPFYLETWFLGLLVVLGFGISISIYDYINKNRYSRVLEKKVKIRTAQLEKSEDSIRDLTQKLITAQESERQRISRDLHDNVSQDLAILKLELEKFGRAAHDIEKRKLTWLSDKLINMSKYIKDFTLFLHPSLIKQTGLINAIQALCNDFNDYSDTTIEFYSQVNGPLNLSEEEQTNLYRFVQEALNNIRKHSNAESAIVILSNSEDTLKFRIEDDGIGFDIKEVEKDKSRKSIGLKSMQERILIAGGELKIKSVIGEGTKLFAAVPLNKTHQPVSDMNSSQTSGL